MREGVYGLTEYFDESVMIVSIFDDKLGVLLSTFCEFGWILELLDGRMNGRV